MLVRGIPAQSMTVSEPASVNISEIGLIKREIVSVVSANLGGIQLVDDLNSAYRTMTQRIERKSLRICCTNRGQNILICIDLAIAAHHAAKERSGGTHLREHYAGISIEGTCSNVFP